MQSNITKRDQKRLARLPTDEETWAGSYLETKEIPMHDFLLALIFVAMVASPALIAASPRAARREDR